MQMVYIFTMNFILKDYTVFQ